MYSHQIQKYVPLFLKKYTTEMSIFSALFVCVFFIGILSWGLFTIVDNKNGFSALMNKISEALVLIRNHVPPKFIYIIPENTSIAFEKLQDFIKIHSNVLPSLGKKLFTLSFHIFIGLFIGICVAYSALKKDPNLHQKTLEVYSNKINDFWLDNIQEGMHRFYFSFKYVFFAQFKISIINTCLTALFLYIVLPLLNYHLPFLKILLFLTFLLGLIPLLGNIISNTLIFLVALSVSPIASIWTLVFLMLIHKFEYFLNAGIIGTKIHVKIYELLITMIVFETFFGLWGLILAPVLLSFLKNEIYLYRIQYQKNNDKI